jgi:putative spermidine/putrescine transport system permease protein
VVRAIGAHCKTLQILECAPPRQGGLLSNYAHFFSDPFLYGTIWTTLSLALPPTILNLAMAVPISFRVRLMRNQRLLTTILVIPITLGTVLVAEGLLNYLGPQGWLNRTLIAVGIIHHPIRLLHNYWACSCPWSSRGSRSPFC